jgi:hypothetical protein
MGTLLQVCLVLHITGIVLLGGTTLMNYIISRQFWNCVETDRNRAIVINSTTLVFGRITGIGGVLTILTGIGMLAVLHGAVDAQLWFRIKMMLVLLIILNALLFARPQNTKLKSILSAGNQTNNELSAVKSKMNMYYAIQLTMLFTIFVLSVFKFG